MFVSYFTISLLYHAICKRVLTFAPICRAIDICLLFDMMLLCLPDPTYYLRKERKEPVYIAFICYAIYVESRFTRHVVTVYLRLRVYVVVASEFPALP